VGIGCSFPVTKRPKGKADNSPSYNAEVKNKWSYTSTPPCVFKTCTRTVLPLRIQVSWDVTLRLSACRCWRFEDTTILPDVCNYTHNDTQSRPTKLEFSAKPLPENKQIGLYNGDEPRSLWSRKWIFVSNVDEVYLRSDIKKNHSLTQHRYTLSGSLVSALLRNHRQTLFSIKSRPVKYILAYRIERWHIG
jgi:hypothetical protein